MVEKSCWFEDVYGQELMAVAANLPSEELAAAQERGRARELAGTVAELLAKLEGEATQEKGLLQ